MWNLLAGYGGMVSIGAAGVLRYRRIRDADARETMAASRRSVAVPIGAVIAAVIAVPVSLVAFRLEGGYFAIGTWVIAEVFRISVANMSWLGGGSGTSLTAFQGVPRALRESLTLWTALAIVAAAIGLLYVFLRSKHVTLAHRDARQRRGGKQPRCRCNACAASGLSGIGRGYGARGAVSTSSATCVSRLTPAFSVTGPRSRSSS